MRYLQKNKPYKRYGNINEKQVKKDELFVPVNIKMFP